MRLGLVVVAMLAGGVFACGGEEVSPVDCSNAGTSASYSSNVKAFLDEHCIACHTEGSNPIVRQGAPAGVNYNTFENARSNASAGAHSVSEGEMPERGGAAELSTADRCLLQAWVNAGTPQ